jgi:hypothetical protein
MIGRRGTEPALTIGFDGIRCGPVVAWRLQSVKDQRTP